MSTLNFWVKVSRPKQCILGGFAAWITALLSNGPLWFTPEKITAGLVISLSVLGASIWHYGARADIYAAKPPKYQVVVDNPQMLLCFGGAAFLTSMLLAGAFLNNGCVVIAYINAIIILFYAHKLDRCWPLKNLSIAGVCVSPLILGWFTGHHLHPIVPPLILGSFFTYLSREISKDIGDLLANHGRGRLTMAMSLGVTAAGRISGVMLLLATFLIFYSLQYSPQMIWIRAIFVAGGLWLGLLGFVSILGKDMSSKFAWIDVGVAAVLIGLLLIRFQMY